MYCPIKKCQQN